MPALKRLGRPRETELRTVLDVIFDIARTGCQWRLLPKDPSFTSNRPEREPNARLDHTSELLPAVSEARRHDRHGDAELQEFRGHLQARRHRDPDQPALHSRRQR